MQTFLPYGTFVRSAQVLDMRRLGKQRVECKQIYNALTGVSTGWANHPATKMWRGYEAALCMYALNICNEWRKRGYKDSLLPFFEERLELHPYNYPHFLGDAAFHASHRSNLLRKAPDYYRQFWPNEPDNLEYVWPLKEPELTQHS